MWSVKEKMSVKPTSFYLYIQTVKNPLMFGLWLDHLVWYPAVDETLSPFCPSRTKILGSGELLGELTVDLAGSLLAVLAQAAPEFVALGQRI